MYSSHLHEFLSLSLVLILQGSDLSSVGPLQVFLLVFLTATAFVPRHCRQVIRVKRGPIICKEMKNIWTNTAECLCWVVSKFIYISSLSFLFFFQYNPNKAYNKEHTNALSAIRPNSIFFFSISPRFNNNPV